MKLKEESEGKKEETQISAPTPLQDKNLKDPKVCYSQNSYKIFLAFFSHYYLFLSYIYRIRRRRRKVTKECY